MTERPRSVVIACVNRRDARKRFDQYYENTRGVATSYSRRAMTLQVHNVIVRWVFPELALEGLDGMFVDDIVCTFDSDATARGRELMAFLARLEAKGKP